MIETAGAHIWSDGAGDIALTLLPGQRIAYMVLWPHARPWRLAKAQPVLARHPRCGRGGADPGAGAGRIRIAASHGGHASGRCRTRFG